MFRIPVSALEKLNWLVWSLVGRVSGTVNAWIFVGSMPVNWYLLKVQRILERRFELEIVLGLILVNLKRVGVDISLDISSFLSPWKYHSSCHLG